MPTGVKLRRRLEALEKDLITEPVILTMPDGRIVTIPNGIYRGRHDGRRLAKSCIVAPN
jgi:hypothetical protein